LSNQFKVSDGHVTFVTTFPDLQKNVHLYENYSFIGACISEQMRKAQFDDALKDVMNTLQPRNPMKLENYFLPDDYEKQVFFLIQSYLYLFIKVLLFYLKKKGFKINLCFVRYCIQFESYWNGENY
jgi:hypothetical protein